MLRTSISLKVRNYSVFHGSFVRSNFQRLKTTVTLTCVFPYGVLNRSFLKPANTDCMFLNHHLSTFMLFLCWNDYEIARVIATMKIIVNLQPLIRIRTPFLKDLGGHWPESCERNQQKPPESKKNNCPKHPKPSKKRNNLIQFAHPAIYT